MDRTSSDHSREISQAGGIVPYLIIALLILVIVVLAAVFFFSPDTITAFRSPSSTTVVTGQGRGAGAGGDEGTRAASGSGSISPADIDPTGRLDPADVSGAGSVPVSGSQTGADPASGGVSGSPLAPGQCEALADSVEHFFDTLDSRTYIRDFQIEPPSSVYFPELIQKLIDQPPVVSGETDDLFTILQNTAHFFRIIGKKNILVLKGILDRERDTFEQVLADFYRLTDDPECLRSRVNLVIGEEPLYAYAGFFLNTMGGRLYLFRRDSMSRMVVNYYAIMIIHQANQEGRNKYGIDIRDAIDNLIIEIESSRIKLKMRDLYLDTLYDLKVEYQ